MFLFQVYYININECVHVLTLRVRWHHTVYSNSSICPNTFISYRWLSFLSVTNTGSYLLHYRWLSFQSVTNTRSCLLHLSMVIFPVRYQHWFMFASFIDGYLSCPLPTLVHVCFIYRWLSFLSVTNTGSCLLHLSMVIFPARYQHWFMVRAIRCVSS